MRHVELLPFLGDSIDVLTCLIGGVVCPNIHEPSQNPILADFEIPTGLGFEKSYLPKANYLEICKTPSKRDRTVKITAALISIHAYEELKKQSYFSEICDEICIQLLEHLRNASGHGNKFKFINKWKRFFLDEEKKLEWRGVVLDKDLNGKECFFTFFQPGHFASLFEDISILVKSKGY